MLLADAIKLEQIDSSIEDAAMERPFRYGALMPNQAPVVLFRVGSIELPGVTVHTSNSRNIEFPSFDHPFAEIPFPNFTTIGHVKIRVSEVSCLEPPTIDF